MEQKSKYSKAWVLMMPVYGDYCIHRDLHNNRLQAKEELSDLLEREKFSDLINDPQKGNQRQLEQFELDARQLRQKYPDMAIKIGYIDMRQEYIDDLKARGSLGEEFAIFFGKFALYCGTALYLYKYTPLGTIIDNVFK